MYEFEEIKIKILPFEGYGRVEIYFSNTEDFILISVPQWSFSFLWKLEDTDTIEDDRKNKNEFKNALSVPMLEKDATKLADIIAQYLLNGKWEK